jgi:hypothetical protein
MKTERIPWLKICVRDGAIVETTVFKIFPKILSRLVALKINKPFMQEFSYFIY